jgi:hypothetical protein
MAQQLKVFQPMKPRGFYGLQISAIAIQWWMEGSVRSPCVSGKSDIATENPRTKWRLQWENQLSLVAGSGHFLFSHIWGIIIPTDFHIFQRGRYTTNQVYKWWIFQQAMCLMCGSQRVSRMVPMSSDDSDAQMKPTIATFFMSSRSSKDWLGTWSIHVGQDLLLTFSWLLIWKVCFIFCSWKWNEGLQLTFTSLQQDSRKQPANFHG